MDIPEHWKLFQCKTLTLCIYGYSRTLKTVPVQNIDTMHSQIFQNTENCSSAKHWHCAFMDIPEHWKLFQHKTLTLCNYGYSRTLKTVPVQNIDTMHLQIFQNTENCSSAKHWHCAFMDIPEHWKLFQHKTLTLCIYGYSRPLKTVPVQNIDTMHLQIFQNTENCSSAKHWHCIYGHFPKLCKILINCVFMDTPEYTIPVCSIDNHEHL